MWKLINIISPKNIAVLLKIFILISLAANIGEFMLVWATQVADYLFPAAGLEFQSAVYYHFSNHCHQMPERSVFFTDQPLPVCNRCVFVMIGNITVIAFLLNQKILHRFIKNKSWVYAIIIPPLLIEAFLKIVFHYPSGFWISGINGLFQSVLIYSLFFILLHTLQNLNKWGELTERLKIKSGVQNPL